MRLNVGVADGTRTHDNWNHNPGLYQLSYSHHWTYRTARASLGRRRVARPAGLEPTTPGLEGRCSIRLSYGRFVGCLTDLETEYGTPCERPVMIIAALLTVN